MVTEIAQSTSSGMESEFEAGVGKARAASVARAGSRACAASSIEKPQRYRLMIQWRRWKPPVDFQGSEKLEGLARVGRISRGRAHQHRGGDRSTREIAAKPTAGGWHVDGPGLHASS